MASKQHRIQLLAVLSGRDTASVQGLHLSDDALGARVVEATLPLLATFEAALLKMPLIVPKVLTDVPGLFAALPIEHFVRHQSIALLSCLLNSTGTKPKEKLGGHVAI